MAVVYDEKFFHEIPEEMLRELRSLREDPGFAGIDDVSRTMAWEYVNDRRGYDRQMGKEMSFEQFKRHIQGMFGSVDNAFIIPPIKSAPSSDRIFCPGFYIPNDRIFELLREEGFDVSGELVLSKVKRLNSLWGTFFDSQGGDFLGDPTITLPRAIIYGETMKGYERGSSSHFGIDKLMEGIGEKYNLPTFSASVPFPSFS
jgi:hypothetical protein